MKGILTGEGGNPRPQGKNISFSKGGGVTKTGHLFEDLQAACRGEGA